MCFENYVPFHLIRCTILEIHPTAMKVFGWISHAPIHPALTKQASVAMRPCWVAQSCKKGNWRAFYHHKHLLSWLDGWLCSHTTKVADAPFVFPWSPGHSFCLKRKIFSSTFLMLLSYISKGLADHLSSISETSWRGTGLNLFAHWQAVHDTGGGWTWRDHPSKPHKEPITVGPLEFICSWGAVGFLHRSAGAADLRMSALEWLRASRWISSIKLVSHTHGKT